MDYDTTRTKDSYEKIYNIFKNNDADILIGTQMIAKGLDFKNVTLVGIIAADLSLNLPDYRSNEKTFQLINQVSGRAGRGAKEGLVILQTYNTENYAIKAAADNDYLGFYNQEIELRKLMNYPPYSDILLINFSSKNEEQLIKYTQNIGILLKKVCNNYIKIDMLGPCPCVISKIKEMFRWQVIFKGSINSKIAVDIKKTIHDYKNSVYNEIRVSMHINPSSLL
jgi:primosomal protein N' (replication factor Y)